MAAADYRIVDENLRATMRFFGRASGDGDIIERDGMLLIDSGVGYAVFNIAMLLGPVADAGELTARLRTAEAYFAARGSRWSLWLCDDLLGDTLRRRAQAILADSQLRRLTEAPGMIAERLSPPARPLPDVVCERVHDARTRTDFGHITSVNFEIPFATCQKVYTNECAWNGDYHGYVGYWHGTPVATVAAVVAAGAIGIYSVSTLPQHRHHGYAESLMRQVIAGYTLTTGIERTILQATRAGYEMYLKMGYRPVSHFTVYMT